MGALLPTLTPDKTTTTCFFFRLLTCSQFEKDMKTNARTREVIVEAVCFLYIILFVYAAVNKIIDFDNFQVELAQSPLLSSFAGPVSYCVPIIEIIIALLLSTTRCRKTGLYLSLSLMVMFSVYILIILNFSPFIPCSCGGILDEMSWQQHLIFNLAFVILAVAAILLKDIPAKGLQQKRKYLKLAGVGTVIICSSTFMAILFLVSEDMIHRRNNFTRRFPNHPILFERDLQLKSNGLYFAGIGNGSVYIGNMSNPLEITEVDSTLNQTVSHLISVDDSNRRYHSLKVSVQYPYFYLADGTEAFVYRGLVRDWKAKLWIDKESYFNSFVPIDSNKIAIRSISSESNENILGVMQRDDSSTVFFNKGLLDKQIDGIFDTDGKLIYNKSLNKLLYIYAYRNEYLITDTALKSKFVGHTIDTTSRANIKVAYVSSIKASKLASPSRIVNKTAATFGDLLFVNSQLIGQYELEEMWDEASIIDIYNLASNTYQFSFYLYDKEQQKISEFVTDSGHVYSLAGKTLSVYKIDKKAFEKNQ